MISTVVETNYGKLCGRFDRAHGLYVFKGVPYARPPVGALRFKRPEAPQSWSGIRPANRFPPVCWQPLKEEGSFYQKEFYPSYFHQPMCEDCLYLNIWTPAISENDRLPVMVWIHGGAFMTGYGHEMEFTGTALPQKGVVLVTLNYRLGAFGFLTHPWLDAENPSSISGNYGLFDQLAALQWVRENIAAFGGDPQRITIFGQSAGAISVQTLVSSPLAERSLFAAAAFSCGGIGGMLTDESAQHSYAVGEHFVRLAGVENTAQLRALTPQRILAIAEQLAGMYSLPFCPHVDGLLLPDTTEHVAQRGKCARIHYLLGSAADDFRGQLPNGPDQILQRNTAFAAALEEHGCSPAYVYHFARRMPGDDAGAFHSAELWYVFGTYDRCWRPLTDADAALSERMISYLANFAASGTPGADWPAYTLRTPYIKELDIL